MGGLNTLRAILVAFAFLAALVLAVQGEWVPAAVLGVGIVAHGLLWLHLYRTGQMPSKQRRTPPRPSTPKLVRPPRRR